MAEHDRHLRPRDGSDQPTTPVELLFDLVYVIAVTQLSHLVIDSHIAFQSVAQAGFLLLVVWWAWIYTTWMVNLFDPGTGPVRLVLVLCGLASLMMSVALPRAFGADAALFAGAYVALQVGRNTAAALLLDPSHRLRLMFRRLSIWSVVTGALWLTGALASHRTQMVWWGPALALDLLAPALGYWLPGLGRAPIDEWTIEGGHFADRFQAFIIIALGESIGVTGLTASARALHGQTLIALAIAFVETGALWWLYFGEVAEHSRRQLAAADEPGRLGRDAYTYLHLPIVAGIIMVAIANDFLIADPSHIAGGHIAAMLVGGPALYLIGETLFRLRMVGSVSPARVSAVFGLCALGALGSVVSALVLAICVTAVLTVLALAEYPGLAGRLQGSAEAGVDHA